MTPMKPSARLRTSGSRPVHKKTNSQTTRTYGRQRRRLRDEPSALKPAFTPATSPCPAASSYPVVPLIWPAKNNPPTFLVSRVAVNQRREEEEKNSRSAEVHGSRGVRGQDVRLSS